MRNTALSRLLRKRADAYAIIKGSKEYEEIFGSASFYKTDKGIMVVTSVSGLPVPALPCESKIFAYHIHEGGECTGNSQDPFFNVGTHYNPKKCSHPHHAGDMPPLFSTDGYAFSAYLTNSFTLEEIIGKAVVIHENPDDFMTQPSGNAGTKIACGIITE